MAVLMKAGTGMAKRLLVHGRVQGVGYRASFANKATSLGLQGWVRNRMDGSVEACVDGEPQAVEAIVVWARRGPSTALVSSITVEESADQASADGTFKVLQTF